jgi:hypothetical protein
MYQCQDTRFDRATILENNDLDYISQFKNNSNNSGRAHGRQTKRYCWIL